MSETRGRGSQRLNRASRQRASNRTGLAGCICISHSEWLCKATLGPAHSEVYPTAPSRRRLSLLLPNLDRPADRFFGLAVHTAPVTLFRRSHATLAPSYPRSP